MIVCSRHARYAEKGEEVFLLMTHKICLQGQSRLEAKLLFADVFKLPDKLFFYPLGGLPLDVAGF